MHDLSVFIPFADWNESIRQQVETTAEVLRAAKLGGEILLLSLAMDRHDLLPDFNASLDVRHVEIHRPRTYSSALLSGTSVARGQFVLHLPAERTISLAVLKSLLHQLVQQDLVLLSASDDRRPPAPLRVPHWVKRPWRGATPWDVSQMVWGARAEPLTKLPQIQGLSRGLPLLVRTLGFRLAHYISPDIGGQPIESTPLPDCWSWKDWAGHRWLKQRWAPIDFAEADRSAEILPDLRVAFFNQQDQRQAG